GRRHPVLDRHLLTDPEVARHLRGGVAADLPSILALLNRDHVVGHLEYGPGDLVRLPHRRVGRPREGEERAGTTNNDASFGMIVLRASVRGQPPAPLSPA